MVSARKDIGFCPNDEKSFESETTEPMKLALEALTPLAYATAHEIRDRFPFNGKQAFEASHRVVTRG
jgi:hypothetical protein